MDWNWFFSSFAQSSAAIVGIIGAFVISKLLSHESQYDTLKEEYLSAVAKKQTLINQVESVKPAELADMTYKFNEAKIERYFREAKQNGNEADVEQAYRDLRKLFSPYSESILIKEKLAVSKENSTKRTLVGSGNQNANEISKREESLNSLYFQAKEQRAKCELLTSKIQQFNSTNKNVVYTLLFLMFTFSTTVVYPLSFLPNPDAPTISLNNLPAFFFSFRGFLICLLLISVNSLFGYFIWVTARRLINVQVHQLLKEIGYFKIRSQNDQAD